MPNPLPPALAELEIRLGMAEGDLDGPDKARAERALKDATTLVLAEVRPRIRTAWAADAPEVVHLVALTAARRGFENPRGIDQETFGAHTVGLNEATGVYLTSREVAQLHREASAGGSLAAYGVGTIRTPSAYGDGR